MELHYASSWEDWRLLRGATPLLRRKMTQLLQKRPSLLYFGDSWFSTPIYPNLARQSIEKIDGLGMIAGEPGATSKDLLGRTRQINNLVDRIIWDQFDLLIISLGGNDAISKLEDLFDDNVRRTPEKAFDELVGSRVFEYLKNRLTRLLDAIQEKSDDLPANFKVVFHNYAPLIRIGVSGKLDIQNIGLIAVVIDSVGPWIWPATNSIFRSKSEAKKFSDLMLSAGFEAMVLDELKNSHPDLVRVVDFWKIDELKHEDAWFDEIHPNVSGFAPMAEELNKTMKSLVASQKRHAF